MANPIASAASAFTVSSAPASVARQAATSAERVASSTSNWWGTVIGSWPFCSIQCRGLTSVMPTSSPAASKRRACPSGVESKSTAVPGSPLGDRARRGPRHIGRGRRCGCRLSRSSVRSRRCFALRERRHDFGRFRIGPRHDQKRGLLYRTRSGTSARSSTSFTEVSPMTAVTSRCPSSAWT